MIVYCPAPGELSPASCRPFQDHDNPSGHSRGKRINSTTHMYILLLSLSSLYVCMYACINIIQLFQTGIDHFDPFHFFSSFCKVYTHFQEVCPLFTDFLQCFKLERAFLYVCACMVRGPDELAAVWCIVRKRGDSVVCKTDMIWWRCEVFHVGNTATWCHACIVCGLSVDAFCPAIWSNPLCTFIVKWLQHSIHRSSIVHKILQKHWINPSSTAHRKIGRRQPITLACTVAPITQCRDGLEALYWCIWVGLG